MELLSRLIKEVQPICIAGEGVIMTSVSERSITCMPEYIRILPVSPCIFCRTWFYLRTYGLLNQCVPNKKPPAGGFWKS